MFPQVDASIPIVLNGETFCEKKRLHSALHMPLDVIFAFKKTKNPLEATEAVIALEKSGEAVF